MSPIYEFLPACHLKTGVDGLLAAHLKPGVDFTFLDLTVGPFVWLGAAWVISSLCWFQVSVACLAFPSDVFRLLLDCLTLLYRLSQPIAVHQPCR